MSCAGNIIGGGCVFDPEQGETCALNPLGGCILVDKPRACQIVKDWQAAAQESEDGDGEDP